MKQESRLVTIFALTVLLTTLRNPLANASSAALAGVITSAEEGPMEGVLVSAKARGGKVTVTVVSDAQGRYEFPADRLKTAKYQLKVRAVGYIVEDPGVIEVGPNKTVQKHLVLRKTNNLAFQLSNAEWLLSMPGTEQQKTALGQCMVCHSLTQIVTSRHDAQEWIAVLNRMRTKSASSTPLFPLTNPEGSGLRRDYSPMAEYLSTINLSSSGKWNYDLKTFPRPKGKATRVIVTEYDLPHPDAVPHDAAVDQQGMVWYTDYSPRKSGEGYLGMLNPGTGEFKEWPTPVVKPENAASDVDFEIDKEGNPWIALMAQGAIAKFDKNAQKFTVHRLPVKYDNPRALAGPMMSVSRGAPMVWFEGGGRNSEGEQEDLKSGRLKPKETPQAVSLYSIGDGPEQHWLYQMDVKTGEIITHPIPAEIYGNRATSHGDDVFLAMNQSYIGLIDAKTGKVTNYPTPTPYSGPRRGNIDDQDRLWFGEYWANKIGMFDTKTREFKEWALPTPWFQPYDAVGDRNGNVWAGSMSADIVERLNPQTGEIIGYPLPTLSVNVRRIAVDSSTHVSCWIGDDHHAKLVRIEPME